MMEEVVIVTSGKVGYQLGTHKSILMSPLQRKISITLSIRIEPKILSLQTL